MDDDEVIERILGAVALPALITLMSEAYRAGFLEALDLRPPTPTSAKFRSVLRHAREHYWQTIEAARALAAAEEEGEQQRPPWLLALQERPPPTDEEQMGDEQSGVDR